MRHDRRTLFAVTLTALMLVACSGADPSAGRAEPDPDDADLGEPDDPAEQRFPDVLDAQLEATGDTWRLSATLSSPYDTPERYADAFRALAPNGEELGVRVLLHDHANEQPFTRSLTGLEIPDDVDTVIVEGRDLEYGWGGDTVALEVPREQG